MTIGCTHGVVAMLSAARRVGPNVVLTRGQALNGAGPTNCAATK